MGTPSGTAAAAMNRAGLRITSQDPRLIAACDEGVTPKLLLEVHDLYPDKPAGYVVAAARRIHAEQAPPPATGASHAAHPKPHRLSAVERIESNIREARRAESEPIPGTAVRLIG